MTKIWPIFCVSRLRVISSKRTTVLKYFLFYSETDGWARWLKKNFLGRKERNVQQRRQLWCGGNLVELSCVKLLNEICYFGNFKLRNSFLYMINELRMNKT